MRNSKETIYQISAVLILISAILYIVLPAVAPWILAFSVLIFSVITALTPYPGKSVRGKRLFNFQIFACIFMIVSTYLMFINNNIWALTMLIGAVFLLYSVVVLPKELEREKQESRDG